LEGIEGMIKKIYNFNSNKNREEGRDRLYSCGE